MDIQLTLLFKGECRAGVCFCKFWMHHMHILSLLSTSNVYKMCLTLYSHYKNIEYAWRVNIKTIPSHKNPGSEIPGTITAFSPLHKHNMHACSILVWIMKPKENNPTDTSFLTHSLWILLIYWLHRSYLFSLMPALFQSIGGCFIYKWMKSTN